MIQAAIVCVDDDEIILNSLGEQLKRNLGQVYEIELATNGPEALSVCGELEAEGIEVALVICDQTMPGMTGDELLIRLHACYPKTLKILLTGQAEAKSVGNIVNAAALYRYISKPWNETDLILTVKEALRRYGQEQQLTQQNSLLQSTNRKLKKSLDLLLATFEAADDGILVLDYKGEVVSFNRQFLSIWELESKNQIKQDQILVWILEQIAQPFVCFLKQPRPKYNLVQLNNGKILECFHQTQRLEGLVVGHVWRFRDVSEREQAKALARRKALHDTLTELPKRAILTRQLSETIEIAESKSHRVAVIIVDLDHFKIINDTLGHRAGDRLIQQVVERLKGCVGKQDTIVRWGGDEFTLLLSEIQGIEDVYGYADRIVAALEPAFMLDQPIHITCSMGMAIYPQHGSDGETLLKNADAALTYAKKKGRNNYQFYQQNITSQANQRLTIDNLLRSALKRNEFRLYYQPIINISTGKIAKMEALIRWQNPQLGWVSPHIFIPIAEENGAIVSIGEWVLKTACAQNQIWQKKGLFPIKISVNLSVRQFQQSNLVATIANVLKQTRLYPSYLELEITESVTMQDPELAKQILQQLNQMGISLSMDDFGTGYSSLSYLKQFPFNTVKIDRSFIKDLHPTSQDIAIVNAVIDLGRGLNLNVVAEGVETEDLQEILRNMGCEYVQGYLYSPPLPADKATKLLQKYNCVMTNKP